MTTQFPPEIDLGDPTNAAFELDMGLDLLDLANLPDPLNSNSSFTGLTGLEPPPSTSAGYAGNTSNIGVGDGRRPEGFGRNGLGGFEFEGDNFLDNNELDMGLDDLLNDGGIPGPLQNGMGGEE